jgi:uncharacterized protein (TIGR03083 family)
VTANEHGPRPSDRLDDRQVAALLTAIGDDPTHDRSIADGPALSALFERVHAAALAARPAGLPVAAPPVTASPTEHAIAVFRHQITALDATLDALAPDDFSVMTEAEWTVHELLAHLVTVEEYFGSVLGLWQFDIPAETEHDHRAMTAAGIPRWLARSPRSAVDAWRAHVQRLLDAVGDGTGLANEVLFHGLAMTPRHAFVLRAFEIWTHHDDIRRALSRPLTEPPAAHLRLMSSLAVRSTPLGLILADRNHVDRAIRVVLTGAGGGTWVIGYGAAPPTEPDTTFIVDAVEFCRMAAQRLSVDELAIDIDGDPTFAADVCRGAQVFAA